MTYRLTKGADGRYRVTLDDWKEDWPQLSAELRKIIPALYFPDDVPVFLDLLNEMDEVHRMVLAGEADEELIDTVTEALRELVIKSQQPTRQ